MRQYVDSGRLFQSCFRDIMLYLVSIIGDWELIPFLTRALEHWKIRGRPTCVLRKIGCQKREANPAAMASVAIICVYLMTRRITEATAGTEELEKEATIY